MPSNFASIKYQYAIYYPMIGMKVRGKLNPIGIFQEYWYGRRVLPMYEPYNPRTSLQVGWRSYFANGMANWGGFDDQTKNYYNKMKYPKHMWGFNRYLRWYLKGKRDLLGV